MNSPSRLLASIAACVCLANLAHADARLPTMTDQVTAGLQLNGTGTRYRGPFRVYNAGLYLTRKASTPEDVFATVGAKRLAITMLRDIDAADLGKLFIRGVEDNMADRSAFSKLVPGLMRMGQIFASNRKLAAGDTVSIDWVPGVGTVIHVRGLPQGEPFREPEFYAAMMRIWIGPSPADWQLKERLLGRAVEVAGGV